MPNTGYKKYNWLIQINGSTGLPTGNRKPNTPLDPDYIPNAYDPISCPLPTTTTTSTTTSTSTTSTTSTTTTTTTEPPLTNSFELQNNSFYNNIGAKLFDQTDNIEYLSLLANSGDIESDNYLGSVNQSRIWIWYPITYGTMAVIVKVIVDGVEVYNQSFTGNDLFINNIQAQSNIVIQIQSQ